nr:Stk1 family PASTA domain-containing Ser/Thr kinase [Lysinibacter cavernae]
MIGRLLDDRYVIRSRIARGGMATVYVATDKRLERRVAIKVMHGHLADDNAFKKRFDQEARSAARLAHPNVVNVFDQGQDSELAYLVMEYLPGITLRDLLKTQGALTPEQTLEISEAVLSGLSAAHSEHIVHRDMKPENILLADDGRIKLGDFGLARAASANTTTGQALLGTIAYLSPELVTKGIADERSDIYAFGIVMYEMITGVQPFTGEQPMQIAYQHANDDVPLPSLVSQNSSPELDALVRWATQRDPAKRPPDAKTLLDEVRHVRSGASFATTRMHTSILPQAEYPITGATTVIPNGTTIMPEAEQPVVAAPPVAGSIETVRHTAAKRRVRGTWTFFGIALLTVALVTGGWWFGGGPGSMVTVADVREQPVADATATLEDLTLTVAVEECSSLDIPIGNVTTVTPEPGTRVARDSGVTLCVSTGPRSLAVPPLVGTTLDEAKAAIDSAGFVFGEVLEERFDSEVPAGVLLAALDRDGNELPPELNEQSIINAIVSAGPLPYVNGLSVEDATKLITSSGLTYDSSLDIESYSSDVDKGKVLQLVGITEPMRKGDPIGLETSQGPELFAVPDVSGQTIREAIETLTAAGFAPTTKVVERVAGVDVWSIATVKSTNPAAGEKLEKGTTIELKSAD